MNAQLAVAEPAGHSSTLSELSTADLLRRAGERDPGAWEEIVRRYTGVVSAKVRSFRLQDADTNDAVQMTWLRLAENCRQVQHPEHLGGWLATTASRECLRIIRDTKRSPVPADETVETTADPAVSPEEHLLAAERARVLRTLVAELPPRRRSLIQALYTSNPRPYAEVARITGMPVGGIGPTRARALAQLRRGLDESGLGSGGGG